MASNAVLNVNPGGSTRLYVYAPITNYGTINWLSGSFEIYNNNNPASYTGGINNMAGGAFNVYCDQLLDYNYGYEYFNNAGTFTKLLNTNTTTVAIAFTNSGSVLAENGTIYFEAGGSLGGSFQASNNASIDFASGTWTGNESLPLSGVLNFSGSTINGSLIVSSNAILNWSGGDLEGALTVAQGGTLTISNSLGFDGAGNHTNTATLTNYGTVVWAGTITSYANYNSQGGAAIIDNAGLWESVADDTIVIYPYGGSPYGTNLFLNTGTLEKIGGTGTSTINWNFDNEGGTVLAVDGTVGFGGGLDLTNGLLNFAISGPSSFGQISVSGTANLAGGIGAVLLNGYVPDVGAQFNVMTFGANTGAFTDYSGLNTGGGIAFEPTVSTTTLTLQAAATNFFGVTPHIVTQPSGQTVNYNSTAMLNVVVSGSSPLQFLWKQDGTPVPGGTNAMLTFSNVLVSQAGTYIVAITNSAGGVVSQPVELAVIPAVPVLTWANPDGISYGTALSTNQLNASANVPGTFAYNPPAGTVLNAGGYELSATFTPDDAMDYTSPSANASISVSQIPLTLTANNAGRTYGQTNPVFSGTITGLTNSDNITANYSCSAVPISPPGSYPIVPVLVDLNGRQGNYSVTLNNGSLTVSPGLPPTFTSITPNTGLTNGGTAVTLTGSGFELGAGVAFAGQPATSIEVNSNGTQISAVTPAGTLGLVDVLVTNPDTTMVTLTNGFTYSGLQPSIVTQPVSAAVPYSGNATFSVAAAGVAPLSYQWFWNGAALSDGGAVSGSASPSLA